MSTVTSKGGRTDTLYSPGKTEESGVGGPIEKIGRETNQIKEYENYFFRVAIDTFTQPI